MAFIDRVTCDPSMDDMLIWKYPSEELRLGTQLIVNYSHEAVFVKGGSVADIFGPGRHTLSTGNLPLIDKLVNLPFGGKTPFSAEIWYVNKAARRGLKWGTKGPIQVIDPLYNYPVSIRSFGQWGLRIEDSGSFIKQLVGNLKVIDIDYVEDYFAGEIVQRLSDALAKYFIDKKISAFQVSANINELSEFVGNTISPELERFGVAIVNFNVERISIPSEEQKKFQDILGKRMEIDQISQARVGQAYTTMRTFNTLEKAAANEGTVGGFLGAGFGLGAGLNAGANMSQHMSEATNTSLQQTSSDDSISKLQKLKQMLDQCLISQEDFEKKKAEILARM